LGLGIHLGFTALFNRFSIHESTPIPGRWWTCAFTIVEMVTGKKLEKQQVMFKRLNDYLVELMAFNLGKDISVGS
jgi:hypothetical protein